MESTLLSKLESSNLQNIHSLFSDYLRPLSDLINSQKSKLTSKRKQEQTLAIRSLAKQFLPFLNKSLSILPKLLSNSQQNQQTPFELFDTYKLCLDCLDVVSSQLSCKPYTVQIQRVRMIYCLVAWERYEDAGSQGLGVLERLRGTNCGSNKRSSKKVILPKLEAGDVEFVKVVVEVVVVIIKCVAMGQGKDCGEYKRVLGLVEEVRPWFRELDADVYEKFHRLLVTYLSKCAIFLVGGLKNFGGDLVSKFYVATLTEYENSSMKDQIYKFSHRICSSLLLPVDGGTSLVVDMLVCVLKTLGAKCKVDVDEEETKFVVLVSYCANKCQLAGTSFRSTVARHLNDIMGELFEVTAPINIIVRLYASGLYFTRCDVKQKISDVISSGGTKDGSAIISLLDAKDEWQDLAALLHLLEDHCHIVCKDYCAQKNMTSMSCSQKSLKAYLLSYLDALKFLCQPLADLISSEKKQIVDGTKLSSVSTHFSVMLDAFHQFCDIYLFLLKNKSKGRLIEFDDNKTICTIVVAAFVLSIKTELSIKKSVQLSKRIIVSAQLQPQELKYLFTSFYNIGVVLYRNKQLKQASLALKLCYRASWTCVVLLCKMFEHTSQESQEDLSEEAITNFVTESCTRCAFFLDVLHQCGDHKIKKVIVGCLENWCMAGNLFTRVPAPMPIVKQWIKIVGKLYKDSNLGVDDLSLYSLLSSSTEVSKKMGIILEQELLAYEDIYSLDPELCKLMQIKICDILLKDVYTTKDCCLDKLRILLKKGRALKASGIEHLKGCIQCLSEAISLLNDANCATHSIGTKSHHNLAAAYCLRAFCLQEAEPNSEQVLQDISSALNLWLSMPEHCYSDVECKIVHEHTIMLLYNVIDLLSIKGDIQHHNDIYKVVFRLFKWKNVELQNGLTMLWECRRLTHALCVSPINEALILNLSEHCGEHLKSVDFWIDLLKGSRPLLVGLKQNLPLLPLNFSQNLSNHEYPLRSEITVGDVKEAASELISNVPLSNQSAFLVGYLYYDLCEKLISWGRLSEALSYAKDAHRLRTQLFQEKFKYSVEQQVEKCNDFGNDIEKHMYNLTDFQVSKSVACVMWSFETVLRDVNGCYLSPWNVLQCYLESTLQVGVINELIGNGKEAETLLLWGKTISSLQSLSLFTVAFSSVLGRLYRKEHLWDLAEKELLNAKQILVKSGKDFSCLKCRLILEVTVDQQLGDLHRSHFDSTHRSSTIERLSYAQSLYKSALHNLNQSEWKNPVSCPIEASDGGIRKACFKSVDNCSEVSSDFERILSDRRESAEDPEREMDGRRHRKTRGASKTLIKEQRLVNRSTRQSSKDQNIHSSFNMKTENIKQLTSSNISSSYVKSTSRELPLEVKNPTSDACICDKMMCWLCLRKEVMESGLLSNYISLKWEIVRRRLSLRVLNGLGKCLESCGQTHQAHDFILQSISTMFSRNAFYHSYSSSLVLLDLIEKEFTGDVFTIERATLLYNICLLSLKGYHSKNIRTTCCNVFNIELEKVAGWLMLAFVLCREVPMLFQKVSRLLATIFLLSASNKDSCLPSSDNAPSQSQWASYFHQASLGTHISYKFFSNMSARCKSPDLVNPEVTGPTCIGSGKSDFSSSRLAPESIQELEKFATEFFKGLPSTPVVCISLIGGASASLLNELLLHPSSVRAWMLLSRLCSRSQPIVLLLPVDSVLEENFDDMNSVAGEDIENVGKRWQCPWGSTVVDDVAPAYKLILEENFLSSSNFPLPDTKENRSLWWMRRKKIDQCLAKLLRNLEDSWLGRWRYVLLGEWSNCKHLDSVHKKLVHDLKSKCNVDVNESLLKVIIGGGIDGLKGESSITQLCPKTGCYIGAIRYSDEESCRTPTNASNGAENQPCLALRLIHGAVNELQGEENRNREPIILVLDSEVQMLPWENIPILRNQEVYRMPSVGSISAILNRSHHHEEELSQIVASFPLIDPLDAFYLLNPSGDLSSTQLEFETWFRDQNLEGKAGSAPTAQELAAALKSHDLFIYFGHGSGAQYISKHEIQKLEKCAATLLMGCSSGSLFLNGCYIPQGTSLSYLLAGSPVTIANLWEVTDKDINRFAKAMLDAWLKERLSSSISCAQCNSVVSEFEALSVKGKAKKVSRKKATERYNDNFTCNNHTCDHGKKIGSFMAQAREACTLPFLIGASPVCYGVPTGIRRKKHL
ncbi:separase isoform X3 [Carica papaya]|uniref:separase isoform X3 n=1 Tax=Carica papaya TaxID=3649 RepID=UPI000B8CAB69|nr:separase isoform X3 [Carica papaya]